jgi:tetratricopeptide (TPR) repeat protein
MQTTISLILSALFFIAQSQESPYKNAMQNALNNLNQSETANEFISVANTFERISLTETSEWLPLYYAAYGYILTSFETENANQKDQYLDKAQQFLNKAFKIAPEESELFALQAFLYPGKIMIDPMGRGPEYIGKIYQALDDAARLNPDNPRVYFLRAITTLNMPAEFGGGPAVAKPIFEKAKEKFEQFQPESPLSPGWGKEINEAELSKL